MGPAEIPRHLTRVKHLAFCTTALQSHLLPLCPSERKQETLLLRWSFPNCDCVESEGWGDQLVFTCFCQFLKGIRLLYYPYLLLRASEPVVWTSPNVGARADAQDTGRRNKSQTNKTPSVYSPTAIMDCFLVQAKTIHFQMDQVKTVTPTHFFLSPVTTLVLTFFSSHFPDMFLWGWSWEKELERDRGQTNLASWSQNSCLGHIFPFKQTTLLLGQLASRSQLWIPGRKTDRAWGT